MEVILSQRRESRGTGSAQEQTNRGPQPLSADSFEQDGKGFFIRFVLLATTLQVVRSPLQGPCFFFVFFYTDSAV